LSRYYHSFVVLITLTVPQRPVQLSGRAENTGVENAGEEKAGEITYEKPSKHKTLRY